MPPRVRRGLVGLLGVWLAVAWPAARPVPLRTVRPERVEGRTPTLRVENAERAGLDPALRRALTGLEEPSLPAPGAPQGPTRPDTASARLAPARAQTGTTIRRFLATTHYATLGLAVAGGGVSRGRQAGLPYIVQAAP